MRVSDLTWGHVRVSEFFLGDFSLCFGTQTQAKQTGEDLGSPSTSAASPRPSPSSPEGHSSFGRSLGFGAPKKLESLQMLENRRPVQGAIYVQRRLVHESYLHTYTSRCPREVEPALLLGVPRKVVLSCRGTAVAHASDSCLIRWPVRSAYLISKTIRSSRASAVAPKPTDLETRNHASPVNISNPWLPAVDCASQAARGKLSTGVSAMLRQTWQLFRPRTCCRRN